MYKKAKENGMVTGRIRWLDAWKGFAMLLVVLGHIADGYLDAGLFPEKQTVLQTLYDVIYSFHMPLFFVLSGYAFYIAYAKKRKEKKDNFCRQAGNIAAVYVIFSVIQWCFKMLFAGQVNSTYTIEDLLLIPVKAMAPYWYLYVLFVLYLAGWLMEQVKRPEWMKVLFFLGISFLGSYVPERILFEAKEILYYSVYFYFGIFLAKSVAPALWEKLKKYSTWYQNLPKAGILRLIGTYSLEIYVLHCFITAANRIILFRLGIDNFYLNVTINLLMATFLPMLASVLLKKMKLYGFFFRPVTTVLMLRKNRTGLGESKKCTKNR